MMVDKVFLNITECILCDIVNSLTLLEINLTFCIIHSVTNLSKTARKKM